MLEEHLAGAIARAQERLNAKNAAQGQPGGSGLGGTGSGAGTGGPNPGGGTMQGLDFFVYKGLVENVIRQNWAWAGQNRGLRALVRFGIASDGNILNVEIAESSGDATYDALALRAVESASPLPAPPEMYQNEFARYELELRADDAIE